MNAGSRIVRSCELVDRIWVQIEDMGNSLAAMTELALANGEFENLQSAGPLRRSYGASASKWTNTAYAISLPVMERRRRKAVPTAWINYEVSVFGGGIPVDEQAGRESVGPALHVSFWHVQTDFDDPGLHVEFPCEWEPGEIKDGRLLYWDSEKDGQFPQWTFSIRLLSLDGEDALRKSIVDPVRAILQGVEASVALPASLPGLIFYKCVDGGESQWNLLADLESPCR